MAQSFMRSDVSTDFKKSITEDDKSIFLDKIINNSKVLKDNVGVTYEEAKFLNKKTYRTLLLDILKYIDIDYNNKSEVLIKSKKIAEQVDILNDFIETNNMVIYGLFLYLAYKITELDKEEIDIYYKVSETIENLTEQQIKEWGLNNKNIKLNSIINSFDKLFEEE